MSDAVSRLNAALEGRYRIERELGEGGMATVYLADDLRHERKVALKVLKPELAAVVGAERFLAEIKTTANLQHPHILPLFDSGEADGFLFYVMPYVAGESLRERLDREHQLPVDEAVQIAKNVAEALDYAHRQGVIHRDIKPANVLMLDGKPVVSDFGIALAVGAAGGGRLTETGLSLGTPHYMSPEQATGDTHVGPQTDVYALGCVLYEMLAGEPPYTGSTPQAILGKILTGEIASVRENRRSVPGNVDAAIRKALARLPADRFRSAETFAHALSDPTFTVEGRMRVGSGSAPRMWTPVATVMAVLAVASLGVAAWALSDDPEPALRFGLDLPEGQSLAGEVGARLAMSPDGLSVAYVGEEEGGGSRIWLRDLRRLTSSELAGTEGGTSPTFSPEGDRLAFLRGTAVWVARLDGDAPIMLADGVSTVGSGIIDWGPDGFIYAGGRGLVRVPDSGGDWEQVVPQDEQERLHLGPVVLPSGAGAVFALGQNETRTENVIAAADLETGQMEILTQGVAVEYSETGHLLLVRADGRLDAVPFDQDRLELTGEARAIGTGIGIGGFGAVDLSVSASGSLMYVTGAQEPRRQVVYVDRAGVEEPLEEGWRGPWESVALSPDGRRLVVGTGFGASPQLWVRMLDGGQMTRLTLERELNRRPVWSHDGEAVTFISELGGYRAVYRKRADGVGPAEVVLQMDEHVDEVDWSPGGEWLVYRTGMTGGEGRDIYAWHVGGDSSRISIAADPFYDEMSPAVSPDGRWLAYVSLAGGTTQVYVRSFPDPDAFRIQISVERGSAPVWSDDGSTLFYQEGVDARARMTAVTFDAGPTLVVRDRQDLFPVPQYFITTAASAFDYRDSDERFIMIRDDESSRQGDLILVQNFFEELKRLAPN